MDLRLYLMLRRGVWGRRLFSQCSKEVSQAGSFTVPGPNRTSVICGMPYLRFASKECSSIQKKDLPTIRWIENPTPRGILLITAAGP